MEAYLALIVAQAARLTLQPIVEELASDIAKGVAKDAARDMLKRVFSGVRSKWRKEPLAKALIAAQASVVAQIERELTRVRLSKAEITRRGPAVKTFAQVEAVNSAIGAAFSRFSSRVDARVLAKAWRELKDAPDLPGGFSWVDVAHGLGAAIRKYREDDDELRDVLLIQASAAAGESFDVELYRKALRKQCSDVAMSGSIERSVRHDVTLWSVFVPPSVRECDSDPKRVADRAKEEQVRLRQRLPGSPGRDEPTGDTNADQDLHVYYDQPTRDAVELLTCGDELRVVILADPGAGKSALLRYIALKWTEETDPSERLLASLPVLVDLRQYGLERRERSLTLREFATCGSTPTRLDDEELGFALNTPGGATFLLDGLDEVFDPEQRTLVVRAIVKLANDHPQARIAVTTRVIGYLPGELRKADFQHFLVQDFEPEQVEHFVALWHRRAIAIPAGRERAIDKLRRAIAESEPIRQLAGNPLLLTIMAVVSQRLELPRGRAELYGAAARELTEDRDREKGIGSLFDGDLKERILQLAAFHMQSSAAGLAGNWIEEAALERIAGEFLKEQRGAAQPCADARALVQQLHGRNFVLCAFAGPPRALGFVHRTFLEFFCARELMRRFEEERTVSADELVQIFLTRCDDPTWQEVLSLLAGLLEPDITARVIAALLDRKDRDDSCQHVLLAARCYCEARQQARLGSVRKSIARALEAAMRFDMPYYYDSSGEEWNVVAVARKQAVHYLVAAGFPTDAKAWLLQLAERDLDGFVRQAAIEELARGWAMDSVVLDFLMRRVDDESSRWVREVAIRELARALRRDAGVQEWLKRCAVEHPRDDVRLLAVRELAHGAHGDAHILGVLIRLMVDDPSHHVQHAAFTEYCRLAPADREDHARLRKLAQRRGRNVLQYVAMGALARRHPRVNREWLFDIARVGCSGQRQCATELLAERWSGDAEIYDWLEKLAFGHCNGEGRRAALRAVARRRRGDSSMLDQLLELGIHAESDRDDIVLEVARGWSDEGRVREWLKQRALRDEDDRTRGVAAEELARAYPEDDDIAVHLRELAVRDPYHEVRRQCVRAVARHFTGSGDVVGWLMHVAESDKWIVGVSAIRELAIGWHLREDVKEWLFQFAAEHEEEMSRSVALEQIVRRWRDDPRTKAIVVRLASAAEDDISEAAIQQLAFAWRADPGTWPLLCRAALSKDEHVADAAIGVIGRVQPGTPEALALMMRIVREASDSRHQRSALWLLGSWLKNDAKLDEALAAWRPAQGPIAHDGLGLEVAFNYAWKRPVLLELVRREVLNERVFFPPMPTDPMPSLRVASAEGARELFEWLREQALFGTQSTPRCKALRVLGQCRVLPTGTLREVCLALLNDPDQSVRACALEVYEKCESEPDKVVRAIQKVVAEGTGIAEFDHVMSLDRLCARDEANAEFFRGVSLDVDQEGHTRAYALRAFVDRSGGSETARALVERLATSDDDSEVRIAALDQLVSTWTAHPNTYALVKQAARDAGRPDLRRDAIKWLVVKWRTDPETFPLVRAAADDESDNQSDVREEALVALARHWSDAPEVARVLYSRAVEDPDASVRDKAITEIARELRDDPRTLALLRDRAVKDESEYDRPRNSAREELSTRWRHDPDIAEFVRGLPP